MTIHPLTPGLLASIAMRWNHATFMPRDLEKGMIGIGPWEERIPEALKHARRTYAAAVAGTLADVQLAEEVRGGGFYSPEHEDYYLSLLAAFPGMLELATELTADDADT